MRVIHKGGFPDDERYQTRAVIYSNLVVAFKVLLDIMKAENIAYEHEDTKVNCGLFSYSLGDTIDQSYFDRLLHRS